MAFRVDASLQIGTGHVMRCLTLADALAQQGASCLFISRAHEGHLLELVAQRGHAVQALPPGSGGAAGGDAQEPVHAGWLGTSQADDARACRALLADQPVDWLVVDHYALDARWESALRPHGRRLLVIDDLADRPHDCDLLLDPNLGRSADDYRARVPLDSAVWAGPAHALMQPGFARARAASLQRRAGRPLRHLLVTLGGVDAANVSTRVLERLQACPLPADLSITVVLGAHAPWGQAVQAAADRLGGRVQVRRNVQDMASLMADADLAIGACGGTAWERCCLGLPSLLFVLADNQAAGARALARSGAAVLVERDAQLLELMPALLSPQGGESLARMSAAAAALTDGMGAQRLAQQMVQTHG